MVLDGVLLAIVVVFGIYGYRKGFVSQAVGLAGLVVVVLFGAPLADIVERVLANEFSIVLPGRHFRPPGVLSSRPPHPTHAEYRQFQYR